jgi:phage terminase large subunit
MNYRKTLGALPERLRKAFLEGDWSVLSGQYFDVFEIGRHTARAEEIGMQEWWPKWISIDWGFNHPSAVYWHCGIPDVDNRYRISDIRKPGGSDVHGAQAMDRDGRGPRIVTYREFVKSGLSPRMLGQAIAERTAGDRIAEVFLSPDAFAHRTSDASIAEQLGEVLAQNGLPRPALADDDRVGGWQLMYQMLENDEWVIAENCRELIQSLPELMRDERRVEDVRKAEGDDAADAARYGLVSGVRYAGIGAHGRAPGAGESPPKNGMGSGARFVPGVPLGVQIERQISAEDPTSRAIHRERLAEVAKKQLGAHKFGKRRR